MAAPRTDDTAAGAARRPLPPVTGTAAQVMIRRPKTLPSGATVAQVARSFTDDHVHMVLLVDGARLRGTIERPDLGPTPDPDAAALALSRLGDRTVGPDVAAEAIRAELVATGRRRVAVVTADLTLLGLVCLKRDHTGFCTDKGVAARASGRPGAC